MGDHVYEVLRCNEQLVSWQMEQTILLFIKHANVTDVYVTGQDVIAVIIYCCLYGLRTIIEPCGCHGGHQATGVVGC